MTQTALAMSAECCITFSKQCAYVALRASTNGSCKHRACATTIAWQLSGCYRLPDIIFILQLNFSETYARSFAQRSVFKYPPWQSCLASVPINSSRINASVVLFQLDSVQCFLTCIVLGKCSYFIRPVLDSGIPQILPTLSLSYPYKV